MEAMRKRQGTYGHGQPPEDVEGDEARPPTPVGWRRLLLRRGLLAAGLDVGFARGQKRIGGGGDGDDADLVVGLGFGRGLVAFDEFVHLHLVDERKMDRRNGEREKFSSPSKTERRRSRRMREGERFRGIR
ncbi:hypothetical protein BHE74_00052681 [Ensete ventricosum]|nr:hypothetical protein GW17_00055646 [Ensete ventricosum]RWW41807.1 hypothetical protein BHE74_00052681 [Ensete ventricosum]